MTYATLMAQLELGHPNAGLLRLVDELAERFDAGVIGIAGCQAMMMSDNIDYAPGDFIMQVRDETKQEIKEAEAEFRHVLRTSGRVLEWRSVVMCLSLSEYVAREARSADLVITSANSAELPNAAQQINTGEFLMQVGRPVLIVPNAATGPKLERIVVAWKETREARRAALDALPLLKKATHVTVVEIVAEQGLSEAKRRVTDVGVWLGRHGVAAECHALHATGDETAQLKTIAREQAAELIVAGAYGHSRFREFAFGGVTRELLRSADGCLLMSH